MYYQAANKELYKDPIIEGDHYLIVFDSLNKPKIYIEKQNESIKTRGMIRKAREIFRSLEMKVRLDKNSIEEDEAVFPPKHIMRKCYSIEFQVLSFIVIPTRYSSSLNFPCDLNFKAWSLKFDSRFIYSILKKEQDNTDIICHLLNIPSSKLIRRIDKLYPGIKISAKSLTFSDFEKIYTKEIEIYETWVLYWP